MRVAVARAPAAAAELEDFVPRLWQRFRPYFERWMSLPLPSTPTNTAVSALRKRIVLPSTWVRVDKLAC